MLLCICFRAMYVTVKIVDSTRDVDNLYVSLKQLELFASSEVCDSVPQGPLAFSSRPSFLINTQPFFDCST